MAYILSHKKGSAPATENFIYNFGAAGFNTGHNHTANTKIVFKAMLTDMAAPAAYGQAFGARNQNKNNNAFGLFHRFNNARRYCFYRTGYEILGDTAGTTPTTTAPFSNKNCIFTATGTTLSWYDVDDPLTVREISAPSALVNDGICPLAIFCGNTSSQQDGWSATDYGEMRLYWFEIYESDVLIHRFVPAYNNDQYCLYDEVDDTYIYDVVSNGLYLSGYVV